MTYRLCFPLALVSQLQRPTVFITDVTSGLLNELPFRILIELCDWKSLPCKQTRSPGGMLGKPLISAGKQSCSSLPRCPAELSPLCHQQFEKKKKQMCRRKRGVDVIMTIQPEYKLFCPIFPFYFCQTNVVFYFRIQECFQRRQSNFHLVT